MAIEIFTKEEFEEQLNLISNDWEPVGLVDGEFAYRIPVDNKVRIMVRSSVKSDGYSAESSKDSIRPWLVDLNDKSIGSKLGKWINRKPGWGERLGKTVETLIELRARAGDCSQCKTPKRILKVRKNNKNKDRIFANCNCNRHDEYQWLDEEPKEKTNGTLLLEMAKRPLEAKFADDEVGIPPPIKHTVEPNKKQLEAITAPIDANVRVFAGPGAGKCVKEDSLVLTSNGFVEIKDCNNQENVIDHTMSLTSASHHWYMGECTTIKVTTLSGYEIEGTPEHPIQVLSEDKIQWKQLDQIDGNDQVILAWNTQQFGEIDFSQTDPELPYIMGQLIADGNVGGNVGSGYIGLHRGGKLAEPFLEWAKSKGVSPSTYTKKNTKSVSHIFRNKSVVDYLFCSGYPVGKLAREKHVPRTILQGKRRTQVKFLQGYFDLESHCNGKGIEVVTASEKLGKQIQIMLLNFGIRVSRKEKRVKGYDHTYWRITISGDALRIFDDQIGYRYASYKQDSLDTYQVINKKLNTNIDVFPLTPNYFRSIREKYKDVGAWVGHEQYVKFTDGSKLDLHHYLKGDRNVSRNKLRLIADTTGDEVAEFLSKNIFVDPVKSLDTAQSPVYDFTVPKTHSFIANGFINHNTFALSRRYEYLCLNGIHPNNILVITFTKSMADEMAQKIQYILPQANTDQISTIHAFCYRELTVNNVELEYHGWKFPGQYAPIKSWQVKQRLEDLIGDYWPKSEDKPGYKEVLNWIDTSKYFGVTLDQCRKWFIDTLGTWFGVPLAKIRTDFDNWLYGYKCLQFSDMLFLMEQELINNPQFKTKMQYKYSHIIIDESQDTNYQAFRILFHILEEAKLFLVGDVNQMMFRFQGAKPELITELEDMDTILFDQNYRSNDEIITAFQNLISHNYSDTGGPYDQKFFQPIQGVKGNGGRVSFEMSLDVFEESAKVGNEIVNLLENKTCQSGDIFVGTRTKAQLGYLEGELIKKGIKYINIAGGSFWDGKHIKNIISYLALAHDTGDTAALARVANIASNNNVYTYNDKQGRFKAGDYCPVRYLGKEFLNKIDSNFNNIDRFLLSDREAWRYKTKDKDYYQYGPSKAQDLQEFVWALREAAEEAENVGQLVDVILDDCYTKWLKATEGVDDEESNIIDNLRTVADVAAQYTSIEEFLAYVEDMIEAAQKMKDKEWNDYVVISTYHRLKGLERKVVFGMGWCEGEDKYGDPAGLLPHTFSLIDPPQFGVLPAGNKSPIEDERCIAFVLLSRAMERVHLSGCSEYRSATMEPSRFIREMLDEK